MKRQPSEWEKIIANETTDKESISKIYNKIYNTKYNTIQYKNIKYIKKQIAQSKSSQKT